MDPHSYTHPKPLEGYENLEPLPTEKAADGKSLINPPTKSLSNAYEAFVDPIARDERGGFDVHIYFLQTDAVEKKYAEELHERVRREFPELRVYQVWDRPIGPHPVGMFEVNLFTPAQFGAFVAWLVIHRGPLSALIHPNTGDDMRDHTQLATWMGTPYPLQTRPLRGAH
ncbi:uncharacterized protein K489DRAFT_411724 [Dissoconium aciculare CBS 342.82]|uniref:Dopa 4,5-dioxygenase n=1 Tax=Dissoconium aciculare CBS 342.82 TaxID=1314786 RepID=A0A6J3LXI4_9PEZI|nr:uncharacterized protein K489DRAFT_411724 [Dissoconium aciculare CBS 342.82]KAF1820465.1 hypothetical protein K489DRAFT_411724 [Dissoconium aciculare CBS 342.82]